METDFIYARETWYGDSRDGALEDASGFHYFKMKDRKIITEAFEYYQLDDGTEVVSPLPEMKKVNWIEDLGFENLDTLEIIDEDHFLRIKSLVQTKSKKK